MFSVKKDVLKNFAKIYSKILAMKVRFLQNISLEMVISEPERGFNVNKTIS